MAENTGLQSTDVTAGDDAVSTQYNNLVTDTRKLRQETLTAGETINGNTLPVPVYQDKSDNEIYACDADDTGKLKYIGFAITNSTDGNDIVIQHNGVVGGFSGLSEGEKYYVQDAVGTIGTSPGTNPVLVGVALSETQLLIMKGRRIASGTQSFSSTTTATKTVGFRPSVVHIFARGESFTARSQGGWTEMNGNSCIWANNISISGAESGLDNTKAWRVEGIDGGGDPETDADGVIDNVDDTSFRMSHTIYQGVGDVFIYWVAEGDF